MSGKTIKRRPEIFSFYDHTGVAQHLEEMAAKGWLLDKMNSFFWTYRKIRPQKLCFSITYFPKASEFDPGMTEEQQTFVDYCAEAGWHLAATSAQIQVFYSREPQPVPIETDAVTQVENIHRAMKRNFLPANIVLLVIAFMQCGMFLHDLLAKTMDTLLNYYMLLRGFPWLLVILLCLAEILTYFRWHKQAEITAREENRVPPTRNTQKLQYACLAALGVFLLLYFLSVGRGNFLIVLIYLLYFGLMLVGIHFLKQVLKKKKVQKNINRLITFGACVVFTILFIFLVFTVFVQVNSSSWWKDPEAESYEHRGNTFYKYHDELPLTTGELLGTENQAHYSYRASQRGTLLLGEFFGEQRPTLDHLEEPELVYTITEVKFPPLYGMCKETLLSQFDGWHHFSGMEDHYMPIDPEPWQAEDAYQRYMGEDPQEEYIICWSDSILEISFDWTPDFNQKTIVAETLNSN